MQHFNSPNVNISNIGVVSFRMSTFPSNHSIPNWAAERHYTKLNVTKWGLLNLFFPSTPCYLVIGGIKLQFAIEGERKQENKGVAEVEEKERRENYPKEKSQLE